MHAKTDSDLAEVDFSSVTELPGVGAHQRQLSAHYTRYHFARQYCSGKDVLEVACGAGTGLGYLAEVAKRVVGGDIDKKCLCFAEDTYTDNDKVEVCTLDAQALSFDDNSFDVVLLFEAVYYLPKPDLFFAEARRVLRPGGILIVVTANWEWAGFNASPFSHKYLSARELAETMDQAGFETTINVAFADDPHSLKRRIVGLVRKVAVALHLVPKTMRGKKLLKRLFYGELKPVQRELTDDVASLEPLCDPPAESGPITNYEVIYATGTLRD